MAAKPILVCFFTGLLPAEVLASAEFPKPLDLTHHWVGYLSLSLFALAYVAVVLEEVIDLRKSKPMMLAAALIWVAIALVYKQQGLSELSREAMRMELLDYGKLLLFLLVSIAYINAMEERCVFDSLKTWLISQGLGFRGLFWITGLLAFAISTVSNNMTTAMVMCAVVMAVGKDNPKFVGICCVNTVVAANAGGAFCPFGDITTLMVWQKGVVGFWTFFELFLPAVVNFMVPAVIMQFAVPKTSPAAVGPAVPMKRGAKRIILLFLLTILTAVGFENQLDLPAAVGMMAGFTYLQFFGYFLHLTRGKEALPVIAILSGDSSEHYEENYRFDIFQQLARIEWDTLLFFYGVVICVGGINFIGYLSQASHFLYGELGSTPANILVGVISALIDNIPVMFAILSMNPDLSSGQWLLVTLTAGVGGSLLSIGSAAGIALMGQTKGLYSFMTHLKWAPVVALGYLSSIGVHFLINADRF